MDRICLLPTLKIVLWKIHIVVFHLNKITNYSQVWACNLFISKSLHITLRKPMKENWSRVQPSQTKVLPHSFKKHKLLHWTKNENRDFGKINIEHHHVKRDFLRTMEATSLPLRLTRFRRLPTLAFYLLNTQQANHLQFNNNVIKSEITMLKTLRNKYFRPNC